MKVTSPFPLKKSQSGIKLLEYNGRELVLLTHTIKLKTGPPQHFDLLLTPLSAQLGPTEL